MSVDQIPGQSGAGMVRDYMGRNHGVWLSIADFIVRENFRSVSAAACAAAPGKRSAGAAAQAVAGAISSSLPDGNHGENLKDAQA